MYQMYSHVNEVSVPVSQTRRNRIRNILILLLLAALIASVSVGLPALQSRAASRAIFIQRMQNEIATAVRMTTSLSRNAGASSAAILAQVRSNLYAISALNEMNSSILGAGKQLLQEEHLTALISSVDNYLQFLTTGMDTGEYQTNLQNALDDLQLKINALE